MYLYSMFRVTFILPKAYNKTCWLEFGFGWFQGMTRSDESLPAWYRHLRLDAETYLLSRLFRMAKSWEAQAPQGVSFQPWISSRLILSFIQNQPYKIDVPHPCRSIWKAYHLMSYQAFFLSPLIFLIQSVKGIVACNRRIHQEAVCLELYPHSRTC